MVNDYVVFFFHSVTSISHFDFIESDTEQVAIEQSVRDQN